MLKNILALILCVIIYNLGNNYFFTYTTVKLNTINTSEIMIGIIHSSFYAGFLFGAIKLEPVINKVGLKVSFIGFALLFVVTVILQGIIISEYAWATFRFIEGICTVSVFVIIEGWLLSISNKHNRGVILSAYMLAFYSSQAFSQHLIDVIPKVGFIPFLITAFFCSIATLPLLITKQQLPLVNQPKTSNIFSILKFSPLGFLGNFASGLILASIYSFIPMYAYEYNISISWVMFFTICGGFLFQYPIGKLCDQYSRRSIIIIISFAILIPCSYIFLNPFRSLGVFISCFLLGGFTFTISLVATAYACDNVPENKIFITTSSLAICYSVGALLSPLFVSIFIKFLDSKAVFIYISFISLLLAIATVCSLLNNLNDNLKNLE